MENDLVCGDGVAWLGARPARSVHAVVTDPPFGGREFSEAAGDRRGGGRGAGTWRSPPSFGGSRRSPSPRFTDLSPKERAALLAFFDRFARAAAHALVPGGHLIAAATPLWAHVLAAKLEGAGLEPRGTIIRLVRTLRGGDRPKGADREFPGVSGMPRSLHEPWLLFRAPLEGTLSENLRRWRAGALRRPTVDVPFPDVILSGRTPKRERLIAAHRNLKPQHLMRQLVHAALPLGRGSGLVVDPFCGGGSTLAAARAVGYDAVTIELWPDTFAMATAAVPRLAALDVRLELDP